MAINQNSIFARHKLDFGRHYFLAHKPGDDTTKRRAHLGIAEVTIERSVLGKISGDTWHYLPQYWSEV